MKSRFPILAMLALVFSPALPPALHADVIELTDGRKITGTLTRNGEVMTIKSEDGKIITAKPGDIAKVTITNTMTPEQAIAIEWSRMAGQVKTADNLQSVIELYKKFIEKYPNAAQANDARTALSDYEALTPNDPVNFRGRWMPRARIEVVRKQWAQAASPAMEPYQAGKMKETLDAVKIILAADAQNPDALTLGGLAAYRSGNLSQARIYFTSLATADPSCLLAENNLAVLCAGQKQLVEAFGHYVKALQIMPDNRLLLDNIAEALNTYHMGNGDKNAKTYRELVKAVAPAETRMQETMAKTGMVRWGAMWVTKQQQERLTSAQNALRDQVSKLEAQNATVRNTLNNLDAQIRQASAECEHYRQMIRATNSQVIVNQGVVTEITVQTGQREAAMQNLDRMLLYRAQLQNQFDQLQASAKDNVVLIQRLQADFAIGGPLGQYNGTQRIMDLGETDSPPAPAAVAMPAQPTLPPVVVTPGPAPAPPVLVPTPIVVPVPVLVPVRPRPQPETQPASQPALPPVGPSTQPATQPTRSP